MLRGKYRLTNAGKFLILEVLIFSFGTTFGLTWKAHASNKEWNKLLHSGVKVKGLQLDNRSIKEDETLIKSQFIDPLINGRIIIDAKGKSYVLDNSKLVKRYEIDSSVIKSPSLDRKLSLSEKDSILKQGVSQLYNINFNYDDNYIKESIKTIENDFNHEAVNASVQSVDHENVKINPSAKGYKIDEDKLENEIRNKLNDKANSDMRIKAPIIELEAEIPVDKVSSINAKVASFSTSFSTSSFERSQNIELASKLINGTLLMPEEVFSFNDKVGERTKERGFMMAPVIVGNKVDSGIGGGICQVSTTLYNAILKTGIKPVERLHHSLPSSYVALGLDATVDWNNIDFKFKNTLGYPIYIESYTQDKNLYINIYSNSSLLNKRYVVSSNVLGAIQAITPNLSQGKASAAKLIGNSFRVRVTRDTYENGNLVASETISEDEYPVIR